MWHACACVRACLCSCDLSRHERERVLFTLRRLFRLSLRLQDFRKDRYFVNEFVGFIYAEWYFIISLKDCGFFVDLKAISFL